MNCLRDKLCVMIVTQVNLSVKLETDKLAVILQFFPCCLSFDHFIACKFIHKRVGREKEYIFKLTRHLIVSNPSPRLQLEVALGTCTVYQEEIYITHQYGMLPSPLLLSGNFYYPSGLCLCVSCTLCWVYTTCLYCTFISLSQILA